MKLLKLFTLGLFAVLLFSNFTNPTSSSDDKVIEIYFSNKLDIIDLSNIKKDLQQKGIKLDYKSLKFGEDGKLTQINYHVKSGNVSGADETEDTQKEIGFIINNNPNSKYDIIVGEKDSIQKRRAILEKN